MPTIEGAQGIFKAMIQKANETAQAGTPDAVVHAQVQRELAVQVFIQNIREARSSQPARISYVQWCPQCSGANVELVGGCPLCHDCGWSKC